MKNLVTELVFILDRSGSMGGLEDDTIGGFNSFLKRQKEVEGDAFITTILFDNKYEILHNRMNIKEVKELTSKDYFVRGTTALLDALGKTIYTIGNAQKFSSDKNRADKVMFIVITDGIENSSVEYNNTRIKMMIERQQERYDWEFFYLGANVDAFREAKTYGFRSDRYANYRSDSRGTRTNFETMDNVVRQMRNTGVVEADWKKDIDQYYQLKK